MSTVKIACARSHREVLICWLGSPGTDFGEGMDVYTLPCGTLMAAPRRTTRRAIMGRPELVSGNPVDGGNKLRLRCRVASCGLDVPLSWETVENTAWARRLVQSGLRRVELSDLAASVSR